MSISVPSAGAAGPVAALTKNSTTPGQQAEQDFLAYMKETPAQRMEDSWLKAHGMTRQSLAAMSPAQQQAVMKQMQQDIENQLKQKAQAKSVDIGLA